MWESLNEQVSAAMSEPVVTAPTNTDEVVTSPEVKPEVTPVVEPVVPTPVSEKVVDVDKINEQLTNLNKALSIERDEKKALREEIESNKAFYDKMKNVFVPEVPAEVTPAIWEQDKFEEWYAQKEQVKLEENKTKEIQDKITSQIDTLSKEWDGSEGKPKYDDAEVYKWQKDNGKTHLLPDEAFFLMKRDDLLDWKSKQVIEKAKTWITSEKPSGVSTEHTPSITKPKTDQELREAALEAMSSTDE